MFSILAEFKHCLTDSRNVEFVRKIEGEKTLNSPGLDGKILREYLCDLFSLTISAKDMEEYMNIGKILQ